MDREIITVRGVCEHYGEGGGLCALQGELSRKDGHQDPLRDNLAGISSRNRNGRNKLLCHALCPARGNGGAITEQTPRLQRKFLCYHPGKPRQISIRRIASIEEAVVVSYT